MLIFHEIFFAILQDFYMIWYGGLTGHMKVLCLPWYVDFLEVVNFHTFKAYLDFLAFGYFVKVRRGWCN